MTEKTHQIDPETGYLIQIVPAERLRAILDSEGSDYSRPADFREQDEWDAGS